MFFAVIICNCFFVLLLLETCTLMRTHTEFHGVDAPVLVRALRVLVARGAVALIESDALDEVGVKFIRQ